MLSRNAPPDVGPGQILPFAAARNPDKIALVAGDRRLTYRDLDRLSDAVATSLAARGIQPADVVSLYGQNSWEWIVAYHGALKSGAVVNPINVMLTGHELAYVLGDCGAKAVFAGPEQADIVAGAFGASSVELLCVFDSPDDAPVPAVAVPWTEFLASADPGAVPPSLDVFGNDLCCIAYTSGTTGQPKGAMQAHRSVLLNCVLTATMHGRRDDDVVVTALPCAHVYGNVAINSTFLAGGTVVLMQRFDAARALSLLSTEKATMFEGVPTMYSLMTAEPSFAAADLSSLRKSTIGGSTSSTELIARWQSRVAGPVLELWGMTELAGLGTTHCVYAADVPGSIGVALPGIDVRIAPLDGSTGEVPTGTPGEIVVRGPVVMLGYHGNPEATAEVLGADGWLHTGDIGYADDSGHIFVVDRLKDMILTGGYNVYPAEIERVISAHPEVTMVAVGKRPDEVKGEIAIAYLVAAPGSHLDAATVLGYCRERLAAYKCPREVVFVDRLPTTSSGKLMRRKLAQFDHTG